MDHTYQGIERRKNPRFGMQFVVTQRGKDAEEAKIAHIKDISKSGIRFETPLALEKDSLVTLAFKAFYGENQIKMTAPLISLYQIEAIVVQVKEISKGSMYEIRGKFVVLDDEVVKGLSLIEDLIVKQQK